MFKKTYQELKNYDYETAKKRFKLYFFVLIGLILIFCLIFGIIRIHVSLSSDGNIFQTLMTSIGIGTFLVLIGLLDKGILNEKLKWLILVIILLFSILQIGLPNIVFEFNLWFLSYRYFSLSTLDGLLFLLYPPNNFIITTFIITISFSFEGESYEPEKKGGILK